MFIAEVALTIVCCLILVAIMFGHLEYDRFILSTGFWRDLRSYRAILKREFPLSLSKYGYKKIASDEYGTLWRLSRVSYISDLAKGNHAFWNVNRSTIRSRAYLVEVVDPSTKNKYYLSVPSPLAFWYSHEFRTNWADQKGHEWRSAKAAIAWGFGMSEKDYSPVVQT